MDWQLVHNRCSLRLHMVSIDLRQKEAHNVLLLLQAPNMSFGHSLARASYHYTAQVEGSLGHSPGSLLTGPRLRVVPAQGAGERARRVADELFFLWLCVCELVGLPVVADSRYISVPGGAMLDGTQIRMVLFRPRRRLDPSCRRRRRLSNSKGRVRRSLLRRYSYLLTGRSSERSH